MKKKEKAELMRMQTMIENDRLCVGGNFDELIVADLKNLLSDFFDLKGPPTISVTKLSGQYKVNIEVFAARIKTFGTLPR